ncbi:ABC transporter permease subunit [Patescibacteria group bacterium]|nr:ABC transporter permease subunit [Patescibacteria group bacterium]
MNKVYIIFKKELQSYFNSPMAYIFLSIFLVFSSWLFFQRFFVVNQASIRDFFGFMPWLLLFLVPAITMRSWAEEKRSGTIELLLTVPLKDREAVMAKFLSSVAFIIIALVLSLALPITVSALGNLDWGPVIGGYLGALFLTASYLALGLFISSLTKNQIVAFLMTAILCFIFFIVSDGLVINSLGSFLGTIFKNIGLSSHYDSLARGVLDLRDLIYFGAFIFFFLFLNIKSLASRNWK